MKNIIITGGAQGIGKMTAGFLLQKGYSVSVFDIDQEAIDEFRAETDSLSIEFFCTDISQEKSVQTSVKQSVERFGNISGLVNNAAIYIEKPIEQLSLEEWNRVISTNLTGAFFCVKSTVKWLKEAHGHIVNISSTRAFQSEPNTESYAAGKGGIVSLTHALAVSLGPKIKVNCISPGWIDVSSVKKKSQSRQVFLSEQDHLQHPAGRVGKPEDIAALIHFLLQESNDFITGQNFIVDGGMTRKMMYV